MIYCLVAFKTKWKIGPAGYLVAGGNKGTSMKDSFIAHCLIPLRARGTRQSNSGLARRGAFLLALICALAPSLAAQALPDYLIFSAQVQIKGNPTVENYGQAEFPLLHHDPAIQNGRHWSAAFSISGMPNGSESKDCWARIRPSLVASGWTFLAEMDVNPYEATMRYQKNGKDAWATLSIFSSDDMRLDLVELGPPALKLTLKPPAATPETISVNSGDFPYLLPVPGSGVGSGSHEAGPCWCP